MVRTQGALAAHTSHVTSGDLRELLRTHAPPCISLYLPTHRGDPGGSDADRVRYTGLLQRTELLLRRKYPVRIYRDVLGKLLPLAADADLWSQGRQGLAVFASADLLRIFRLPEQVPEGRTVGSGFHIKPLLRVLQREERYQLLTLTLSEARLYEGSREHFDALDLSEFPSTLTEALGIELTEFWKVTRGYGGGAAGPAPMFHGQHDRKAERNLDRDKFFRMVDHGIREHFTNRTHLPLLLAALPEHQAHFRALSRNPRLLEARVEQDPAGLSPEQLRQAAQAALAPYFEERLTKIVAEYGAARAHARGSDRLEEVAAALAQGRVGTLLVEAERHIPGRVDPVLGRVLPPPGADAGAEAAEGGDVLDDFTEAVLRTRGQVLILPREQMPTTQGLAAIYRF